MRVIALTLFTLLTYIPASLAQAWPVTSISLTLSTSSAPSDSPDVDFSRGTGESSTLVRRGTTRTPFGTTITTLPPDSQIDTASHIVGLLLDRPGGTLQNTGCSVTFLHLDYPIDQDHSILNWAYIDGSVRARTATIKATIDDLEDKTSLQLQSSLITRANALKNEFQTRLFQAIPSASSLRRSVWRKRYEILAGPSWKMLITPFVETQGYTFTISRVTATPPWSNDYVPLVKAQCIAGWLIIMLFLDYLQNSLAFPPTTAPLQHVDAYYLQINLYLITYFFWMIDHLFRDDNAPMPSSVEIKEAVKAFSTGRLAFSGADQMFTSSTVMDAKLAQTPGCGWSSPSTESADAGTVALGP